MNGVPYEMATTEKTPGPGGGMRRRRPSLRPSLQAEEQEATRPADRPRSRESMALSEMLAEQWEEKEDEIKDILTYTKDLKEKLHTTWEQAQKSLEEAQEKQKANYDAHSKPRNLTVVSQEAHGEKKKKSLFCGQDLSDRATVSPERGWSAGLAASCSSTWMLGRRLGIRHHVPPSGPGVFSVVAVSYGTPFIAAVSAALLCWSASRCPGSTGAVTVGRHRPICPNRDLKSPPTIEDAT
ncbi:hypothetical protein NDU88_003503 [Pleurodeles waltl]|uniref:Uncharacterized protein n=1 Tax=Pleurodeles waltl TaxID=8319 RepID=A0AAV7NKV5_PLEWA|nr:hypothetical protein NDU88_003503 [Pleurodeles waltl]